MSKSGQFPDEQSEEGAFERQEDFDVAGQAGSVGEAVRMAGTLKPDVVVTDVRLPDGTGFDLSRQLRSEDGNIGIVGQQHLDIVRAAFSCDLARQVMFMWTAAASSAQWSNLYEGMPTFNHHALSHRDLGDSSVWRPLAAIDQWYSEQTSLFLQSLQSTPDVDGLSLLENTLVVYAIFRVIHVTLTLAGVAAFILSIGMAVDANILIFERTKEELRAGKTLFSAIEAGFNRAWNSIFDSNVSSILTAAILFYFGSPVIRGFALVLIIGVLVSMFSAIVLTRTALRCQPLARRCRTWSVLPRAARLCGVAPVCRDLQAREARHFPPVSVAAASRTAGRPGSS